MVYRVVAQKYTYRHVCMYVGHVLLPVRLWPVGVTVVWWR